MQLYAFLSGKRMLVGYDREYFFFVERNCVIAVLQGRGVSEKCQLALVRAEYRRDDLRFALFEADIEIGIFLLKAVRESEYAVGSHYRDRCNVYRLAVIAVLKYALLVFAEPAYESLVFQYIGCIGKERHSNIAY